MEELTMEALYTEYLRCKTEAVRVKAEDTWNRRVALFAKEEYDIPVGNVNAIVKQLENRAERYWEELHIRLGYLNRKEV